MKSFKKLNGCFAATALALLALPHSAAALEHLPPFQPGASTGVPLGALPPPGVYFSDDNFYNWGDAKDAKGNTVPVNEQSYGNAPLLLWVPDFHILGAQYAASLIQPFQASNVDSSGVGGPTTLSAGLFNTIIKPIDLSWKLGGGMFVSSGVAIYLPDGYYTHSGTTISQTAYANGFTTFEPDLAFSYLKNGWDFTLHNVVDINTKNNTTDYQSGSIYYLDGTLVHSFGPWTAGLVWNYSQQFTNDTQFGRLVNDGNRFQQTMVGPAVSYNFGKVTLEARYLDSVSAKNTISASFVHLTASVAF